MKYFKIFLACIIAFVIMGGYNAKGQPPNCPDGFNTKFVEFDIGPPNHCRYSVQICYKCEVGTHIGAIVTIQSVTKLDPGCDPLMDENAVLTFLYGLIFNAGFLTANICDPIGPCDIYPGGTWYELWWFPCWGKERDMGPAPHTLRLTPCWWGSTAYCSEMHRICWDGNHYVDYLMYGPEMSGNFTCQGNHTIPPDPPDIAGAHSDCWELPTPCNP